MQEIFHPGRGTFLHSRAGVQVDQDAVPGPTSQLPSGDARPGTGDRLFEKMLNAFQMVDGVFRVKGNETSLRRRFMVLVLQELSRAHVVVGVASVRVSRRQVDRGRLFRRGMPGQRGDKSQIRPAHKCDK